jgi:hypothetical protein
MAEYEILQGSPALTEEQMNNMPVQPESSVAPLSLQEDEVDIMVTGPSYDPSKRDVNAGRLFGKNALDATFKFLYDNPATADRALGKQLAASKDPLMQELVKKTGVVNELTRTSEKMTAKSLALRDHFGMTEDEVTPGVSPLGWQKIVAGLGGAAPSMLITAVSAGAAGGVAVAAGAGEKVVKGAQLAGAAYASYSMEKPVLEKELMDAGFEAGFADRMSTYYAIPVAMLDAGSFGFLTGVMRPAAGVAVSTTIGRMLARGVLSPVGGLVTGMLGEGTTEAIQGQIQTEFEVGLGLQNRDFQSDLSSRVVEFVVGALMGGAVGTLHMSGQLQARKAAIEDTFQKHKDLPGVTRSSIAEAYDASTLAATDRILDELGKDTVDALGISVNERAEQIQEAIDKAQGRDTVNTPDQVEVKNRELMASAQARFDAMEKRVAEGATLTEKEKAQKARLQQRILRLQDQVAVGGNTVALSPRMKMITEIRNTFAGGQKFQIKEIGQVHEAFRRMLRGTKLSLRATKGILKNVLSIKTADEFNAKQGQVIEAIDTIVNGERVESMRDVAGDILDDMSTVGKVNPKTIVFSEHLQKVFTGKVPAAEAPASSKPLDVAKYAMETLVADLAENDSDVAAAERAVNALKDFYLGELENRLSYQAQVAETDKRIADTIVAGITKGKKISPRQAGLDSVRQNLQKTGFLRFLFPTNLIESFLTIVNDLDVGQKKPNMQGTMVKEYDPATAYRAWMTLLHRTREAIDYKLAEVYGPKFLETLTLNRTANFIDVESVKEDGTPDESVNITKGVAMSLYMMQRNTKIRAQMIKMGYSEAWLDAFAEGNVFSTQDHAWMNQVDAILKSYAEQVQPIFEKLTGRPFRAVDNYFMVQRYMFSEDIKGDEVASVVKAMMDGEFESVDPSDDPRFKKRVMSKKEFLVPDITEAITRYSSDMNHFIAYAEYAYKLKALLSNSDFKAALAANAPEGMSKILNTFLKHLVDGSQSRGSDRAAMKAQFTMLGWLARNKIASPRSGFMQFTALAGFTDPTASTPVTPIDLAQGVVSLFNALRTGEAKDLLDTGYMQERWLGAFDQASKMAEDMARFGVFSKQGKLDPGGVLKKIGTNKMLQEWITLSTRLGDRAPSLLGGWTVYQKVLNQTGDKVAAVTAAIKMIEEVNGSLDPGKSAEIYQGNDMLSTLFKLFTRSTSIYLDRYVRMHKAFAAGQISKGQYAQGLALYHFWIPMFTSMVAMGAGANFDDEELWVMMAAGPLAYHLLLGMMFKGAAAGVLQVSGLNEKFAIGYDNTGNLIDGYIQDVNSMSRKIVAAMESPDFEEMWAAVAAAGKAGDITPLPVGYISRMPEAMYKILEGYWTEGIMEMMGYSSAATKVE